MVGGKFGYTWEWKKDGAHDHYTSLSGTVSNQHKEGYGEDNAAIWWLDEDPGTKQDIPRLFRTAILLRSPNSRPLRVLLSVKAGGQHGHWHDDLVGTGQSEAIDPVTIDPGLRLNSEHDRTSLTEMGKRDLANFVHVALVTWTDSE
ncbi:hypothetical protein X797_007499 [Metarhizium robertsii]|uniref:Uncharacterized protein n=2 Tax=Metarhizium robertsii TaxID=568076 RepID=E9F5M8_METRA|nr:uncharacterized protein MAA_07577 [Metarhizium robertsii ARSEF 23]EFY97031.1 hypothetical protein MAA_07577 [Metarhizium robertsii ARSEF 23]EXU99363.1 hypothetical protein X797_007499 [Metarhizium robertsii]